MYTFMKKAALASSIVLAFSGCAVVDHELAKRDTKRTSNTVEAQFEAAAQTPVVARVAETNGVWVNKRSISTKEEHLPAAFRSDIGLSFAARASLKDMTALISRESGIRFAFAPDVVKEAEAPLLNAGFSSAGELRALLDRVTAQANMSWRYNEGSVEVYRFETKVYQLAVLPGVTTFSGTVSNRNTSGTGATASTSGQDTKYEIKQAFWAGVKDDIKGLVQGGSYSVSETNGTVTVTGTPQVLVGVASYVKNMNALHTRQVALDVRVYAVDVNSGNDFGLSWDLVFSNLKNGLGVTGQNPVTLPSVNGLGLLSAVLGPSSSSKFANSSAVVNALSSIGNTTVAAESSQMVLAGETVSLNSLHEVSYLAEITSTPVPNAQPTIALKPGTVTEGFAMTLTPNIISGDFIQLAGSIDIASLGAFSKQGPSDNQITTPDRTTRAIPLRVGLKTGETYVFGLRQNTSDVSDSGVGGTSILATPFGGQHGSKESRKTIVVTVTPHIINQKTN
jgi:type IVB pilus formation R64 PilN family outer membrane protein